jgi:hypothetical protein
MEESKDARDFEMDHSPVFGQDLDENEAKPDVDARTLAKPTLNQHNQSLGFETMYSSSLKSN